MRPRRIAPLALLAPLTLLTACTPPPYPPDTARLAPGTFNTYEDPDVAALNFGQYAFADPSRTYGRPAEGARAVASVDYLAGELTTAPRWANIQALTKVQMIEARQAVRQAVGIAPDAPSQLVVDSLAAVAAARDPAGQLAALRSPAFTLGPEQTLARLANLPYIQIANVATQKAANEMFEPGGGGRFWPLP